MSNLYNVDLEAGTCLEEIEIDTWSGTTLAEQIVEIREAAEGLTNPRLEAANGGHEDDSARLVVKGTRQLTDAERAQIFRERDRDRRFRQHVAAFRG